MNGLLRQQRVLFVLAMILLLAGCQTKEKEPAAPKKSEETPVSSSQSANEKDPVAEEARQNLEAPPLPETLEEVVEYPTGELAYEGSQLNEAAKEKLQAIEPMKENADEDELNELFTYLYSLFKNEFEDPFSLDENQAAGEKPGDLAPEEQGSYNVIIALDASGSMANRIGSKTRMDLAKEAIESFASKLPKEANVGLRVYGHKGSGSQADKAMSCASNEVVYPIQPYDPGSLKTSLDAFKPAGWTPLAGAIEGAMTDLEPFKGEQNENVVYIVSDGVETCGGDPVASASKLKDSGISPMVHIIGFDVPNNEQQQLKDVAEAAGGTYINAKNHEQLNTELEKGIQKASEWLEWFQKEKNENLGHFHEQREALYKSYWTWKEMLREEKIKLQYATSELYYAKKITSDQKGGLDGKRASFFDSLGEQLDKLKDTAEKESYSNMKEANGELRKLYKENVSSIRGNAK